MGGLVQPRVLVDKDRMAKDRVVAEQSDFMGPLDGDLTVV